MLAEPIHDVEAAHSVVAVTDDRLVRVELLQIRWNRTHWNKDGAFDAALSVFPRFADVNQEEFFAVVEALLQFCG